jgi:hypothetical protein
VLKALRDWVLDVEEDGAAEPSERGPAARRESETVTKEDARLSVRHDFCGHRIVIRRGRALSMLHLKDLSCRGACGLTDMPIAVGAMVFLSLRKGRFHAAEVRWVKNVMIGLRFYRPLDPDMVEKLHAAHLARKAAERHDHQWELSGLTPANYPR